MVGASACPCKNAKPETSRSHPMYGQAALSQAPPSSPAPRIPWIALGFHRERKTVWQIHVRGIPW
eukprot:6612780-Prorocentrum_lima.AAC.1